MHVAAPFARAGRMVSRIARGALLRLRGRAARFAVPLALALLLTGCFRVEISIRVSDDGSGTVSMLVALDTALLESLPQGSGGLGDGFDPRAALAELDAADLPPGATVEEYRDGDFEGVLVTMPFSAGDDVAQSIDQLFASTGGEDDGLTGEDGMFERLVLARDGDGWRFEADVAALADAAGGGEDDLFGDGLTRLLFSDASFRVRLQLPGEVSEHNADETGADGELIWNLDIFSSEPRTLTARAESSDGGGASPFLIAAIAAAVVAAVALAALVIFRRPRGAE